MKNIGILFLVLVLLAGAVAACKSASSSSTTGTTTTGILTTTTTTSTTTSSTIPTSSTTTTSSTSGTSATTPATTSSTSATTTIGSAANGQVLYQANCASCHGANGAGGMAFGTATAADLRQPSLSQTFHNDTSLISRAILAGLDEQGQPLDPIMPRFQSKLTQQNVADIIAFLMTLGGTATPTATSATTSTSK